MKDKPLEKYAGIDLAVRVDSTNMIVLQAKWGSSEKLNKETTILEETHNKTWNHIDYDIIADEVFKIQQVLKIKRIGFDRTGVGDGVRKLFHRSIPLFPIVATATKKFEIITMLNGLFHQGRLIIHTPELYEELTQQEKIVSDAGNLLYRHPQGFHDDRFWGLGYAVDAAQEIIKGLPKLAVGVPLKERSIDEELDRIMKPI